jgi:hypothetical protein
MRALHAEAMKRGLDHEGLREVCRLKFGVASMAGMTAGQLKTAFRDLTGKNFVQHRKVTLPPRGYAQSGQAELASPEELEVLERACALRGWGPEAKKAFVRRQLRGREVVRTRADFQRVFRGVQAMNRRDGKDVVAAHA